MNAPHPGTNLTGPPGYIGCPGPQAGYPVPPAGYASPGPAGFPVQHQPVTSHPGEPTQVSWMPAPLPPLNCPPGLEYLTQIDQLLIHQQMELLEAMISYETNNRYEIKNGRGQRIYFAAEDTAVCTRLCCGSCRPFTMRIQDLKGQEVITLKRPLRCSSCCFPCCLQEVSKPLPGYSVKSFLNTFPFLPPVLNEVPSKNVLTGFETRNKYEIKNSLGQRVYFASEDTDCCTRNCWGPSRPFTMRILDNLGREVITLERPLRCSCCCCPCCLQEVKSLDDKYVVGKISKHWTGLVRELFTDADNFGIQFPLDLDVKMKAVMLGACFLIVSLLLLI
ncbi:hypothetical protein Celaphus_00013015 [Cervus elaphus hippelaphus]|uniref:Phospholipid scramblase n=1 Tax=Cervus elaphus hippelaphus TaxID=46360 RepID=A0A212CIE5_CEREH|nr:hypothetical protein Celaphus_00013015 [Cervus elaphus hippelaphus]